MEMGSLPPPGLPVPDKCLSFWQRTTRQFLLLNEGTTANLPPSADAIIIGSGISGALTAYELLSSPNGPKTVVMLEAREACSGASGSNEGHCRPDAFRGFAASSLAHGPEQAMKIITHEKLVLQLLKEFIETHKINCDFDYGRTFDVVMSDEFLQYATASYEEYKAAGGDTSDIVWLNADEARKATRVPAALGACEWTAASVHPAKLGQALLIMSKSLGLSLFTHTPVISVTPDPSNTSSSASWIVHTPRGSITTPIVVHATNAYAATLLPEQLGRHIIPLRAQGHKVIPTPPFSGPNVLTHTYSFRFALRHFYSLIQRKTDGAMILGASSSVPGLDHVDIRTTDDSAYSEEIKANCLTALKEVFPDWGEEVQGEGYEFSWTGIIGMTGDRAPFVGSVPSLPGQFVIAGFNGHGMAQIFGCATGLVKLILGGTWDDTKLPECFEITEKRLERLSKSS